MNDTAAKKSELVVDALQYAHDHGLDINKLEDVQKILDEVDPSHEEDPEKFMELLKTSETFMNMNVRSKSDKNRVPN